MESQQQKLGGGGDAPVLRAHVEWLPLACSISALALVRERVNSSLAPVKPPPHLFLNHGELLKLRFARFGGIPLLDGTKTSKMAPPRRHRSLS